jgi:uncharacterized membrane protein
VLLMLLWMRAAVIIYALFFGLLPFPGLHIRADAVHDADRLGAADRGHAWSAPVRGLLLRDQRFCDPDAARRAVDCADRDGHQHALVWNNLPVMLAWGAIVLALFLLSLATGLLGLIVVFPLLGHGTWHAYRAIRP